MGNYQIVTVSCSNMRSWGRQALSGNWAKAALGALLFMVLLSGPLMAFRLIFEAQTLEKISDLYTLLVGGPLNLGFVTYMISIFRRKETSPLDIMYGFEKFFKAVGLMFVVNLLVVLWTLLLIIPGIIAAYRYSMAFYILSDNPEIGIMDAIRESKKMMDGNKLKFFLLQFSFIGWALLAGLTFGIGFIWLLPYASVSFVGFYEVARGSLRPMHAEPTEASEPAEITDGGGESVDL